MTSVSLAEARALIDHVHSVAAHAGLLVSCSIVDAAGHEVATARMDEAPWFTADLARVKARTAALMGRDTADLADLRDAYPEVLVQVQAQLPFTPTTLPGGVVCPGGAAVGVSGATPDEDVDLAQRAIAEVLSG
jgi:glc operon protein GlcG